VIRCLLLTLAMVMASGCAQTPATTSKSPPPPDDRALCAAAVQRYRAGLAAAAEGCMSDHGCVPFDSCFAVIKDRGAAVVPLRDQMRQACKAPESQVELECTPRSVRCVARRCLRF